MKPKIVIDEKRWVHKMPQDFKQKVQKKGEVIDGFGYSHGPSASVWKTATDAGYVARMNRALDLFEIPKGQFVVADVGCGPWCGVFFVRKWARMYAVDPSWQMYESMGLIKRYPKQMRFIEDYAQTFVLPEPADIIFSINALNHGGDINKSIDNIVNNLKPDGLFFLHLHLRDKKELSGGHPVELCRTEMENILKLYNVIQCRWHESDPIRAGGHETIVAAIKR